MEERGVRRVNRARRPRGVPWAERSGLNRSIRVRSPGRRGVYRGVRSLPESIVSMRAPSSGDRPAAATRPRHDESRLDGPGFDTELEFAFEEEGGKILTTMVQRGFASAELREECRAGLPNAFARLDRPLEEGLPLRRGGPSQDHRPGKETPKVVPSSTGGDVDQWKNSSVATGDAIAHVEDSRLAAGRRSWSSAESNRLRSWSLRGWSMSSGSRSTRLRPVAAGLTSTVAFRRWNSSFRRRVAIPQTRSPSATETRIAPR